MGRATKQEQRRRERGRGTFMGTRGARRISEMLEQRRLLAGQSATGDSLTIPPYASHPGAPVTLFIDFDGNPTFSWTNSEGTFAVHGPAGASDPVPAFDLDGDPNNFSTEELSEIGQVWQWVSEKYSPFNVNVTTVDPGNRDDNKTVQCIVGGYQLDWYGSNSGGVAAIGGFSSSQSNTCFCFSADPKNIANPAAYRVHYMGDTVAHESGHEFGLVHERTPGATPKDAPKEYYPGDGTRAPIMGGSSNNQTVGSRGIWWKTNNWAGQNSPDTVQDELAVLTSNTGHPLTFRGDDRVGPGVLSMTSGGRISQAITGTIEQTTDVDAFSFNAATSRATFTVNNWALGGMLAPKVRIYNSSGTTITATVTQTNTQAIISTDSLIGGQTYYLEVGSQGGYGDIGQFSITGSMQTFAAYDVDIRFINVGGLPGNNNITLSVIDDGTSQGALEIRDVVNGTLNKQTFSMAGLAVIYINLASGDDTVTVRPLHTRNGLNGPGVQFDGGGGSDTLRFDAYTDTADAFNVNSGVEIDMGQTGVAFYNLEAIELVGNATVGNAFNIHYFTSELSLTVNAGSGNDVVTVDADVLANAGGSFAFNGGGGTDTMTLNGSGLNNGRVFNVFDGSLNTFPDGDGGQRDYSWSSIEFLNLYGGNGDDYADVYALGSTTSMHFYGNGGNDYLELGDPHDYLDLSSILGVTRFSGGGGNDTLRYSDQTGDTGRTYSIGNGYLDTSVSGTTYIDSDIESLAIEGCDVASTFTITGGNFNQVLTLDGGAGNDSFVFTASTWNANVNGGAGVDFMTVDDRTLGTYVPFRADLFPASYQRRWGSPAAYTQYTINYVGVDSPTFYTAAATTTINIAGTAPTALGYQYTFIANSGNDSINVYPHDAAGNGTILGPLGIGGSAGTDTITLDDSTQTVAHAYSFYNQYGPSTQNIGGVGAGGIGIGSDGENLVIKAGSGDDTFSLDSFETGSSLALYGNGGDDRADFTPSSKNVQGNILAISAFTFDGGGGTGDALRMFNDASTAAWTYTPFGTQLSATNGSYGLVLAALNVESMYVSAGSGADTFNVRGVSPGQAVELDGKAGSDVYTLGNTSTTYSSIFGRVQIDGGTGDSFTVDDAFDSVDRNVHVLQGQIGGVPGDNLFGSGGVLRFTGISSLSTVKTGSGADVVSAAPNVATPINLIGGSPTTTPGDQLRLALAGLTGAVVGASSVTSGNRATLSFSGFETSTSDAIAPTVAGNTYGFNTAIPTVDFTFSEQILWTFDGSSVALVNNSTGQTIPASGIAATYDPTTRIVHFTFPTLLNHSLPNGNYHATLVAGPADVYGNALASAVAFDFFVLAGDANHDRHVDFNDLLALAKHYGQSGRTFADGDFTYDGTVDFNDLLLLAKTYGVTLAAPAPQSLAADAIAATSTATPARRRPATDVLA